MAAGPTPITHPAPSSPGRRPRLLLLLPTTGYRTQQFIEAAARLDIDLTVGTDEAGALDSLTPDGVLVLDFTRPLQAAQAAMRFASHYPIDAVVGVDDLTILSQAAISDAMSLGGIHFEPAAAARNKYIMREELAMYSLPGPAFYKISIDADPETVARTQEFPCVLKPLSLSGSRGVIRANDGREFVAAFDRIRSLLRAPEFADLGQDSKHILVESYLPGPEIALEGLMLGGEVVVLAIFDKPDPLEGPYFEESIYVTPSRLSPLEQILAVRAVEAGAKAMGLLEGPIHAELRLGGDEPVLLEVNPRSIGGRCSRALRFEGGMSLEEIILRHALHMEIPSFVAEEGSSAVMMLPTRAAGVFLGVQGSEQALSVPGVEDLVITLPKGKRTAPLPEGAGYLGFLFARADEPEMAVRALREAASLLRIDIQSEA